MMRFEGENVSREFEAQFKIPFKDMSVGQLWWIIKIAKHVRGRCRSNAALHNYLARTFTMFKFSACPAKTRDGRDYEKLIIMKDGHGQVMEDNEEE